MLSRFRSDPGQLNQAELLRLRQQLVDRSIRIDKDISATNDQISSPDRQRAAIFRSLANNSQKAQEILVKNATAALQEIDEYNHPFFQPGLLQAVRTDGIISASINNNKIKVEIDMDRAAGSLSNYAHAVTLARRALRVRTNTDPIIASGYWFTVIYAAGRTGGPVWVTRKDKETGRKIKVDIREKVQGLYDKTITARISRYAAGKLAPWWSLLENGNATAEMSSNREGIGLPANPPTHFVRNSITEIYNLLSVDYRQEFERELSRFRKRLEKLKRLKNQNEEDRRIIDELLSGAGKTRQEIALEKIRQRLRERYAESTADYRRIENLIRRLAAGERIEQKVTVGRNTRIRVLQILNELNLEYRDLER